MSNIEKFRAAGLPDLIDRINKNSLGWDTSFNQFWESNTVGNYPPYNIIQLSNHETRLEIALAGFKREEVKVYSEYGKLVVQGNHESEDPREAKVEYVHRGLANRSFERAWTLSEDVKIDSVTFEDGLLIVTLKKIVPDHHARKEYL
jgi:HSP20 family molecular chaperone IbpA